MKRIICIMLLALCLLSSCTRESNGEFFAMDTYMYITVYGESKLIDESKDLVEELDGRFSVSSENGELYALNKLGKIDGASAEFYEMLECAKFLYERTGGAYDVTSLALTELWKRCEAEKRTPTEEELTVALLSVGMSKISFDKNGVSLNGVKGIDLGSIAKGYAGEAVARQLEENGANGGILNFGGNVTVFGKKTDGKPYTIGITDPNNPDEVCGYVGIESGSVVTSGKYNRSFKIGDKAYHHIIDARTGLPCDNGVASVTVICENGMWADALSTALLLLGEDGALEYYRIYGGFEAVMVMDDGRIITTSSGVGFVKK